MAKSSKFIELSVVIEKQTEKAYMIDNDTEKVWIPKSQIKSKTRLGQPGDNKRLFEIQIPEWLAIKNGLV